MMRDRARTGANARIARIRARDASSIRWIPAKLARVRFQPGAASSFAARSVSPQTLAWHATPQRRGWHVPRPAPGPAGPSRRSRGAAAPGTRNSSTPDYFFLPPFFFFEPPLLLFPLSGIGVPLLVNGWPASYHPHGTQRALTRRRCRTVDPSARRDRIARIAGERQSVSRS